MCLIRTRPLFTVRPTFSFPTWDPYTYNPVTFNPKTFNCVWDSECQVGKTCEGGKCVYKSRYLTKDHSSSEGFSSSGGKIAVIVLSVVVAGIVCMYHVLCKSTRNPPNLPPQNVNVNAPPTGVVRVEGNDHEMQSGNVATTNITVVRIEGNDYEMQPRNAAAATNIAVVESEDDAPLPPVAPPPYNSLEFESGQTANGNFSEQPPPSYDEAIRNPAVP